MIVNSNPRASQQNMNKLLKCFSFIAGVFAGDYPLFSNISCIFSKKFETAPDCIIRGSLETDSWEKPEVENYRV
jgi:hypothetical protein